MPSYWLSLHPADTAKVGPALLCGLAAAWGTHVALTSPLEGEAVWPESQEGSEEAAGFLVLRRTDPQGPFVWLQNL